MDLEAALDVLAVQAEPFRARDLFRLILGDGAQRAGVAAAGRVLALRRPCLGPELQRWVVSIVDRWESRHGGEGGNWDHGHTCPTSWPDSCLRSQLRCSCFLRLLDGLRNAHVLCSGNPFPDVQVEVPGFRPDKAVGDVVERVWRHAAGDVKPGPAIEPRSLREVGAEPS